MTKLRQMRATAAGVVVTTILAYLFASNHCALATMAEMAGQGDRGCCHSENEKKSENPGCSVQCCAALNAPIPHLAAAPVGDLQALKPAWSDPAAASISDLDNHPAPTPLLETGPPGVRTFVEIVLNRSLLAHAPPVFVA